MTVRPLVFALAFITTSGLCQVPPASTLALATVTTQAQPYPDGTGTPFGERIAGLLSDPAAARAHWGVAVTTLDGTPVYGLNEAKLFRPASSAKLFTTAAAMDLLGPDRQFSTRVWGDLSASSGIVNGNLVLVGGGDPSFGTADLPYRHDAAGPPRVNDLQSIADELLSKGVHRITGSITTDDTLFLAEGPPEGWAAEDLTWGYGALPSALSFADNQMLLTVNAHGAKLDQVVPFLKVQDAMSADAVGAQQRPSVIAVEPVAGRPLELLVKGHMAPSAPSVLEHVAVNDSARYVALALRSLLMKSGIAVTGEVEAVHTPPSAESPFLQGLHTPTECESGVVAGQSCAGACMPQAHPATLLGEHKSPPLKDEVVFTLKTSANLHAEDLLHQLALTADCPPVSTLAGARVLRRWLLKNGIADGDFILYDGSGLSTKDLVTPRAEAQLLAYATSQPWFPQWKAALPVGGVDGTLTSRFREEPLLGHVYAKTGTLGESRALAGYVRCASGRELIFSILVDNHPPGDSTDRRVMDEIVAAIEALN